MILRNHGLLTVGSTVDEAAYLYTLMERSCEVQLKVEAAAANGVPKVYVPDEAAQYTYENGADAETLYWEVFGHSSLSKIEINLTDHSAVSTGLRV